MTDSKTFCFVFERPPSDLLDWPSPFCHWFVDMMLAHLWLDLIKLIHFVQLLLVRMDICQVLVCVLLSWDVGHYHRLCWIPWLRLGFDLLLFLLDGRISVELIVFCHVAVCTAYNCSHWGWWLVWHSKWVSAFWIKGHLDLQRGFSVMLWMDNHFVGDRHHRLVRLSESVGAMWGGHPILGSHLVQLFVVNIIWVSGWLFAMDLPITSH